MESRDTKRDHEVESEARLRQLEWTVDNFRIAGQGLTGGFPQSKLKPEGNYTSTERLADLEERADKFTLVGQKGVQASGSIKHGYTVWAEPESEGGGDEGPEPISGCTDPEAENYNPDATVDDDSCEYGCLNCCLPDLTTTLNTEEECGDAGGIWCSCESNAEQPRECATAHFTFSFKLVSDLFIFENPEASGCQRIVTGSGSFEVVLTHYDGVTSTDQLGPCSNMFVPLTVTLEEYGPEGDCSSVCEDINASLLVFFSYDNDFGWFVDPEVDFACGLSPTGTAYFGTAEPLTDLTLDIRDVGTFSVFWDVSPNFFDFSYYVT